MDWITSKAHNFDQTLPLKDNIVKCTRCNAKTEIGEWDIERCRSHFEPKESGYLPE